MGKSEFVCNFVIGRNMPRPAPCGIDGVKSIRPDHGGPNTNDITQCREALRHAQGRDLSNGPALWAGSFNQNIRPVPEFATVAQHSLVWVSPKIEINAKIVIVLTKLYFPGRNSSYSSPSRKIKLLIKLNHLCN